MFLVGKALKWASLGRRSAPPPAPAKTRSGQLREEE